MQISRDEVKAALRQLREHAPTWVAKIEKYISGLEARGRSKTTVWLREVGAGTDSACWVVCAKGDPGAVAFVPR